MKQKLSILMCVAFAGFSSLVASQRQLPGLRNSAPSKTLSPKERVKLLREKLSTLYIDLRYLQSELEKASAAQNPYKTLTAARTATANASVQERRKNPNDVRWMLLPPVPPMPSSPLEPELIKVALEIMKTKQILEIFPQLPQD